MGADGGRRTTTAAIMGVVLAFHLVFLVAANFVLYDGSGYPGYRAPACYGNCTYHLHLSLLVLFSPELIALAGLFSRRIRPRQLTSDRAWVGAVLASTAIVIVAVLIHPNLINGLVRT